MEQSDSVPWKTTSLLYIELDGKRGYAQFKKITDPKKQIIAAFADLAINDGFVSLAALRSHIGESKAPLLPLLISELRSEGLLEPAYDREQGEGIKLTSKGAVRLWFWCWPQERQVIRRQA